MLGTQPERRRAYVGGSSFKTEAIHSDFWPVELFNYPSPHDLVVGSHPNIPPLIAPT